MKFHKFGEIPQIINVFGEYSNKVYGACGLVVAANKILQPLKFLLGASAAALDNLWNWWNLWNSEYFVEFVEFVEFCGI